MNEKQSPPSLRVFRLFFIDRVRRCDLARSVLDADTPSVFARSHNLDYVPNECGL